MAKNVLSYVQSALSVMDSDQVDTINDTEESSQIASLLKDVYDELMQREEWPHQHGPLVLTAAADTANPTKFTIPDSIKKIEWLGYNISESTGYVKRELEYCTPELFLRKYSQGEGSTNKLLVDLGDNLLYYVTNDRWPAVWTSFDDEIVVMDAFHSTYQSTLTEAKLVGWGVSVPELVIDDATVPDLPRHFEPLLQAELNRQAFRYFKQVESVSDEQKATRQLARQRRESSKITRDANVYYRNRFGRHG